MGHVNVISAVANIYVAPTKGCYLKKKKLKEKHVWVSHWELSSFTLIRLSKHNIRRLF